MTRIFDDPARFAEDALAGFVAAFPDHVTLVDGGVVRATAVPEGTVAVVTGGGSGHYPAFAGLVGAGLAAGAACGRIFASPSASQVARVARAAETGGGVLLTFGNYAGDVLHFGEAERELRAEGYDVRTVLVTDDVASGSVEEIGKRRGIGGSLAVYRIAGASAERGDDLDTVERIAAHANARTRSLGVAVDGCTLPGADTALFEVPAGMLSMGLGIHGEPGVADHAMPTATELAALLVEPLLAERPDGADSRVVPIVNGLGTVKYEEMFLLFGRIRALLVAAGLEVLDPEVGEFVTSLDMGGVSLSLVWVDDELLDLWRAPCDAPAFRRGTVAARGPRTRPLATAVAAETATETATPAAIALGDLARAALDTVRASVAAHEAALGDLDAIAGDGDHGIGMRRGAEAAARVAHALPAASSAARVLQAAGAAWAEDAGGTSGALWGAGLRAAGASLGNRDRYVEADLVAAAHAFAAAITNLGKAELGDKTMVDAISPALARLAEDVAAGADFAVAARAAAEVATHAAAATAQLSPRLGRARPLAERSLGHPDPGATSFALILTALTAPATPTPSKETG